MAYDHQTLVEFYDSRNTSREIAQAILEHTDWDVEAAHEIWANGCDAETSDKIMSRAWELAAPDEVHLWWGITREDRPTK